ATSRHPWPAGTDRHAGVSSFGFGGTNAHVVLREAPARAGSRVEADGAAVAGEAGAVRPYLLPISARSEGALRAAAGRWAEFLEESAAGFADICRAAAIRRTHHGHRLAIVAETAGAAVERLREFGAGTAGSEVAFGRGSPNGRSGLTFVFTGQGQQWAGMGRD